MQLTVTRDPGESDIEVDGELLPSTLVNYDRSVDVDPPVVEELY